MRSLLPPALVLLAVVWLPPDVTAGPLRMEFKDGYVTISATDVPLRQILTEWARLGQTRVVNLEKIGAGTLTVELSAVPEKQALETLLRTVPGYMVAQRASYTPGSSRFDRIVVMPGTVAPPVRGAAEPPPPPPMQPPNIPAMAVDDQDEPVQEVPEGVETAVEQEQPLPPQNMPRPGFQPTPPQQNPQVQPDEDEAQQPAGPVSVPATGAVTSPTPGQLPLPPPKPQEQ